MVFCMYICVSFKRTHTRSQVHNGNVQVRSPFHFLSRSLLVCSSLSARSRPRYTKESLSLPHSCMLIVSRKHKLSAQVPSNSTFVIIVRIVITFLLLHPIVRQCHHVSSHLSQMLNVWPIMINIICMLYTSIAYFSHMYTILKIDVITMHTLISPSLPLHCHLKSHFNCV